MRKSAKYAKKRASQRVFDVFFALFAHMSKCAVEAKKAPVPVAEPGLGKGVEKTGNHSTPWMRSFAICSAVRLRMPASFNFFK